MVCSYAVSNVQHAAFHTARNAQQGTRKSGACSVSSMIVCCRCDTDGVLCMLRLRSAKKNWKSLCSSSFFDGRRASTRISSATYHAPPHVTPYVGCHVPLCMRARYNATRRAALRHALPIEAHVRISSVIAESLQRVLSTRPRITIPYNTGTIRLPLEKTCMRQRCLWSCGRMRRLTRAYAVTYPLSTENRPARTQRH
jgi:hypothetical protein